MRNVKKSSPSVKINLVSEEIRNAETLKSLVRKGSITEEFVVLFDEVD